MDVFSAMSASLTPLQVAHQLAKFATKVEGAHKKLLQYCDHLILVDHVRTPLHSDVSITSS